MATPTQISTTSPRPNLLKFALGILLSLLPIALVLAIGGVFIFRSAASKAQPQLDGTVVLPGLQAPVTVIFDARAVPNITASSMEDLFYAQGYVTAQERLW